MKYFITELGVVPSVLGPMEIYCDNNGAIAKAKEPWSHQKIKHVSRKFHLIRHFVHEESIRMCKFHMDMNVSDLLTKTLSRAKHVQHRDAMGVRLLL